MINMNSPTVQTIMQSTGYNPFVNGQYVPQPQQMPRQNTYSSYYDYNPYLLNQRIQNKFDDIYEWENSYDPMPKVVINEARGINTTPVQQTGTMYNNPYVYNNGFNNPFNGYMNPILMNNLAEQRKLQEREEAIRQGKIWRKLLQNVKYEDEDFDIDQAVKNIESIYYNEPYQPEMSIKEKIIVDKNRNIAEIESRLDYYRMNNMHIPTPTDALRSNVCAYYNHINSIIGDNCDMVDYFTRVYPELKFEQLTYEAERNRKNLKNKYDNKDYDNLLNKAAADRPDSYYYKLMESFADNGVSLHTADGLYITPDQMEVKLPERLLRKRNKMDQYYEQRKKFYDSVFKKEN